MTTDCSLEVPHSTIPYSSWNLALSISLQLAFHKRQLGSDQVYHFLKPPTSARETKRSIHQCMCAGERKRVKEHFSEAQGLFIKLFPPKALWSIRNLVVSFLQSMLPEREVNHVEKYNLLETNQLPKKMTEINVITYAIYHCFNWRGYFVGSILCPLMED